MIIQSGLYRRIRETLKSHQILAKILKDIRKKMKEYSSHKLHSLGLPVDIGYVPETIASYFTSYIYNTFIRPINNTDLFYKNSRKTKKISKIKMYT